METSNIKIDIKSEKIEEEIDGDLLKVLPL